MTEPEFTAGDVTARRDGPWIVVSLAGETIYRRFTRDKAFTRAQVVFREGRSPAYPKIRNNLRGVELCGDWRTPRHFGHNRLEVPITTKENTHGQRDTSHPDRNDGC